MPTLPHPRIRRRPLAARAGSRARPILARSTFRRIEENDLVLLTVAPRYEGYHAAIGRPVLVGNPGPAVERALAAAIQAQEACRAALRPGIEGQDGGAGQDGAGLAEHLLDSGVHSVGVIEFEPSIFGPSSSAVIQKGMVISVDIPLFNAPWGGLRIEDGYLITVSGAEHLYDTPFIIRR